MASKNSRKSYAEDSYYHIYNRGVEKRIIFQDDQDYGVFLSYLKDYLLPKDKELLYQQLANPKVSSREKDKILKLLRLNNFYNEITLLSYCLMPNHFHLLIKQRSGNSIDKFMNSLCIRYVMYFNRKYKRVGSLFQDVYKAVLVETEPQLLYLTAYIHRNPLKNRLSRKLASSDLVWRAYISQPSSFPVYLGQRKTEWVHPEAIMAFFSQTNPNLSYQAFVEQSDEYSLVEPIQNHILEI